MSWTVSSCAALKRSSSSNTTRASSDHDINLGGGCIAPVAAVSMHWFYLIKIRWSDVCGGIRSVACWRAV